MKLSSLPLALLAICLTVAHTSGKQLPGEAGKAKAARKILEAWQNEDPEPGERKLHVICWRPQDKPFAQGHKERIPRMLEHIQQFYANEMHRNGMGRRSFNLDYREDGKLVIHEAVGEGNYADYGRPDGDRIKKECLPVLQKAGIEAGKETLLIFTNLGQWNPVLNTFVHKSPYYAGGNHRGGTAWQLDSPELDPKNLPLKQPKIMDGEYGRISLGKHVSIFIGGIAHEMGHAFGLPHCRETRVQREAFGTALMGAGNRTYFDEVRKEGKGSFIPLAHALRLASHPQFSGTVKGMQKRTQVDFLEMSVKADGQNFTLEGRIDSNLPAYAVIAYLDPEGRGNYDSRTKVAIPGCNGQFTLECDALVHGKRGELRVVACLVNGAAHTWRNGYSVHKNGTPDVQAMQTILELDEFTQALQEGRQAAQGELEKLPDDSFSRAVAATILEGRDPGRKIRQAKNIPPGTKEFPLSKVRPDEASVGWLRPAYDHVPRPESPYFLSAGEIFKTGIYAHAPARHLYNLKGAGWKKLTGQCGLPVQRGGSLTFHIKLDGKEVFRTPKTEPGKSHSFSIDLQGAQSLELLTNDANDGKAVDWGLWLSPTLHR